MDLNVENPYREYMLRPKIQEPYTPTEKRLQLSVLTDEFLSQINADLRAQRGPAALQLNGYDLESLFTTYTHKHFPLAAADPAHFANFVLSNARRVNPSAREPLPHRTRDPRFKQALPTPHVEDRTMPLTFPLRR